MVKSYAFKVRRSFSLMSGKKIKKGSIFNAKCQACVRAGFELFKLEFEDGERHIIPCECIQFYEENISQ